MSKKLGLILTGSLILFNACLFAEEKDKLPEKKKQVITGKALGYNETVSLKGIKNAKNHDNCKHPKKNTAKVFGFK